MTDLGHLTKGDGPTQLQPMLGEQARHHAQLLRAAADLILAGEPVAWAMGGRGSGLAGVSYSFDAERFERAAINVRERVQAGDGDYSIRVLPRPSVKYPSRKRR